MFTTNKTQTPSFENPSLLKLQNYTTMIDTNNNNEPLIGLFSSVFENDQKRHSFTYLDDGFLKFHPTRTSKTFEPIPFSCTSDETIPTEPVRLDANNNQPTTLSPLFNNNHPSRPSTSTLNDTDVICGRNKSAFNHIGNRRFRVTVSIFLKRYMENTCRLDRSCLIYEIIDTVQESGSRFLRQSANGEWVELSEKEQRNKVGHALRDAAAAYRRNNK